MSEGIWIQEGSFVMSVLWFRVLCSVHHSIVFRESLLGMLAEQQLTSDGPSLPSLLSPPWCLIHFPCSLANVFRAIPQEVGGTPAPETTSVFSAGIVQPPW